MTTDTSCETCKHYCTSTDKDGECRINTPVVILRDGKVETIHPPIITHHWCEQHQSTQPPRCDTFKRLLRSI